MFGLFFILMTFLVVYLVSQSIEETKGTYNYYLNKNREYAIKKIRDNYEFYMLFPTASGINYKADSVNVRIMPDFDNAVAGTPEVLPFTPSLANALNNDFQDIRLFLNPNVGGSYINNNSYKLMLADASQPDEYFTSAASWPKAQPINYAQQIEYGRQIVFDSFKLSNNTTYLNTNSCGITTWDDRSAPHCLSKAYNTYGFQIESKDYVNKLILLQKKRIALSLDKIYRAVSSQTTPFYSASGAFNSQLYKVIQGSNMATSFPLNCNSTYAFTPNTSNATAIAQLDCSDLFGIYGQPINYYLFSNTHIALDLTLPLYHTAPSTVAQEYNYDIFSDLDTNYIN